MQFLIPIPELTDGAQLDELRELDVEHFDQPLDARDLGQLLDHGAIHHVLRAVDGTDAR